MILDTFIDHSCSHRNVTRRIDALRKMEKILRGKQMDRPVWKQSKLDDCNDEFQTDHALLSGDIYVSMFRYF